MNRKRESRIVPELHGLHHPLARNELNQEVEIARMAAKMPGDQNDVLGVQAQVV